MSKDDIKYYDVILIKSVFYKHFNRMSYKNTGNI